jgi:hypothetical protein
VTAASVRTTTAAAAVPAALVVLGHLALDWNGADGYAARRTLAFQHGIALAVVLAAVLAAARFASALERQSGEPIADSVGIAGTVAVLGHLAWVWRDSSDMLARLDVTVTHILALIAVLGITLAVRRWERQRVSSSSNRLNRGPIGHE